RARMGWARRGLHPRADRGSAVPTRRELIDLTAVDADIIDGVFRREYGRCVAALTSAFGDLDMAEDAVQEAFIVALRTWPDAGLPANPGGGNTTTPPPRAP